MVIVKSLQMDSFVNYPDSLETKNLKNLTVFSSTHNKN